MKHNLTNFRYERVEWPGENGELPHSAYFVGNIDGVEFREKLTIEFQQDLHAGTALNFGLSPRYATEEELGNWFIEMIIQNKNHDYKRLIRDKKLKDLL